MAQRVQIAGQKRHYHNTSLLFAIRNMVRGDCSYSLTD